MNEVYQEEFLNKIDKQINQEEKDKLDEDFCERELYEALKSLKDNKSPGFDGLMK